MRVAPRTQEAAVCLVHARRHSRDMGATEIKVFLTHLSIAGKVSASTRNPAKSALQFLSAGV
ncbi:MAG: phage integrase N-terminal SAM-like domain-containing protein [Minisyncoccota bacterium]